MKALTLIGLCLIACGGGTTAEPPPEVAPAPPKAVPLCSSALPGAIGVTPLRNDTSANVDLAGTDDLLMVAMNDSGCFTLVERERLSLLVDEMKLCADDNPDKEYMNCESFAKKGKLIGAKTIVTGTLTFFEPDVKGAELSVKIPGIGGIEGGRSYTALRITLRALDVETGEVRTTADVSAVVPSDQAGVDVGGGPFQIRAAAHSRTPMADALSKMLRDAALKLKQGLS